MVSFGPKNCGPNLLLLSKDARIDVWPGLVPAKNTANSSSTVSGDTSSGLEGNADGKASRRNQMLCSITLQVRHYTFSKDLISIFLIPNFFSNINLIIFYSYSHYEKKIKKLLIGLINF